MEISVYSIGSVSSESLESLSLFNYLLVVDYTHCSRNMPVGRVVQLTEERSFDCPFREGVLKEPLLGCTADHRDTFTL
jgi:hypothetical protein